MRAPTLLLGLGLAVAQEALSPSTGSGRTVLENTGKPMRVEYHCGEEDLRAAGADCTAEHPCPVYLELAGVEGVGTKIFLTGNIHTSAITLWSVLLASADGGKSWTEPHERIPGAILEQVQFVDFQTGWVGGQLVHPLPRDPFLLLTTDGGATWRRRPIFDEGRVASLERFWFDSRTQGTLWIDRTHSGDAESRYERYESLTGGESWMLREVSARPIPGAQAPPRETGWRIRADRATKAFHVERQEADRWRSVAAFLIQLGECRPPEQQPMEPPAETPEPAAPNGSPGVRPAPKPPPKFRP
ncbi:MAG: sialidase family protein [Bryobacterales bacterium]|nr:glycoside hydrolase [Bryobacteraceae bacterium]MDW8354698.1 sialidase family protein [Bryobacterales bacterium]